MIRKMEFKTNAGLKHAVRHIRQMAEDDKIINFVCCFRTTDQEIHTYFSADDFIELVGLLEVAKLDYVLKCSSES